MVPSATAPTSLYMGGHSPRTNRQVGFPVCEHRPNIYGRLDSSGRDDVWWPRQRSWMVRLTFHNSCQLLKSACQSILFQRLSTCYRKNRHFAVFNINLTGVQSECQIEYSFKQNMLANSSMTSSITDLPHSNGIRHRALEIHATDSIHRTQDNHNHLPSTKPPHPHHPSSPFYLPVWHCAFAASLIHLSPTLPYQRLFPFFCCCLLSSLFSRLYYSVHLCYSPQSTYFLFPVYFSMTYPCSFPPQTPPLLHHLG